jgi:rod shape determining protein RodA
MITYKDVPQVIWIHAVLIMAIGLAALYSASFHNTRVGQMVFYDQLGAAALSILVMAILSKVDYRRFFEVAYPVYIVSVIFLILVFLLGRHALGATRWFSIGGVSFQPSEFSKLAVILMLGRYFSQRRPHLSFNIGGSLRALTEDLLIPLSMTAVSMLLIFKQPDLGTAILVFGIFASMLYMSGIPMRIYLGFIALLGAMVPFGWHLLKDYQRSRLLVFMNPNHDPLGAGYTIIQSKIAIGSGQLFGKGWLSGTQSQLNFLPERHTDFIFSVIGEEWGLAGGLFLVYCYTMLIYCGLQTAAHNKDRFGQAVAAGIVTILALQVIINIGMVMGLLPVVGITLPFVSYGRTSFIVFAIMLGFLLNLSKKRTLF